MSASAILLPPSAHPESTRRERPVARTTFQLACDVLPSEGQTPSTALAEARKISLKWAHHRFPPKIEQDAWDGESFICQEPGYRLEGISIANDKLWTMRLEHPDQNVARRTWTVDLCLREADEAKLRMALRLQCVSAADLAADVPYSRPGIVRSLIQHFKLQELLPFTGKPWLLETEADLEWLLRFLEHKSRTLPVYLLSQFDEWVRDDFVVDANDLAERVQAAAHVIKMPYELGYKWTDVVGRRWSSFRGAVRTFRPDFNREEDAVADHPRILAERIKEFQFGEKIGPVALVDMLEQQTFIRSAKKNLELAGCLFLEDARVRQAELSRLAANEVDDWRSLYEDEIKALNGQIGKLRDDVTEWQSLAEHAEQDRILYIEKNSALRSHADALRRALEAKSGQSTDREIPIPDDYSEMEEWVNNYLLGRLELHPRARRALGRAQYSDVPLVYRSLLILAREYRNMRLGHSGAKNVFDSRISALGLRCGGSIAKHLAGEQRDTYFVPYPPSSGQKHLMDHHLRKGSDHDERNCLAIYFFWHEESQQVVVGWLPSHLQNRKT